MTQAQAVIETIEALGGIATLNQINQNIFKIKDCVWKTKTPFASIRRIVQLTEGIYKIKPGLYALETHRKRLEIEGIIVQTEKNKDSDEVKTFINLSQKSPYNYFNINLSFLVQKCYNTYVICPRSVIG